MKKFLKGMHKDAERVDQPQATYRDALNANVNDLKGAVTNEQGNVLISSNIKVVGQATLPDNKLIVFGLDTNTGDAPIIRLVDPVNGTNRTLLGRLDLNFSVQHPIEATVRTNSKGDRLVYFTDNKYTEVETDAYTYVSDNNPPRVFNIDRQIRSLDNGGFSVLIYGDPNFDVHKLDILPNAGLIPRIDGVAIENGGGLSTAAYHLALAYVDEDLVETDYLVISNPVYIVQADEDLIPMELMIGDQRGTQTKKSIAWKVRVFKDFNYKFIQPAIIRVEGGAEGIESRDVFKLEPILHPRADEVITITHTGLENYATGSLEDVITPNAKYLTAKTLVQSDNRLYMANLKTRPDIGYQKFANAIELVPAKETIQDFEPIYFNHGILNNGYQTIVDAQINPGNPGQIADTSLVSSVQDLANRGYRDANRLFRKKSYRRGEVYAFYISFILNDGTETFAYHIPGRAPEKLTRYNGGLVSDFYENELLKNIPSFQTYNNTDIDAGDGPQFWEWLNTDVKVSELYNTSVWQLENNHDTGYWENDDETYPDTEDFDIWSVDEEGNAVQTAETLRGKKVRHHKLPSNQHTEFKYISTGNQSIPNNYEESDGFGSITLSEDVTLLGIKLQNIRIPKDILRHVQGYKVYYAKRKEEDKTIIGSGVPAPAAPIYSAVVGVTGREQAIASKWSTAYYMNGEFATNVTGGNSMSIEDSNGLLNWSGNFFIGVPTFKIHNFSMLRKEVPIATTTHLDVQYIATCRFYRGGPWTYGPEEIDSDSSFDSNDWLHPDLGNTTNAEGTDPKVRAWKTALLIANDYNYPGAFVDVLTDLGNSGSIFLNRQNSIIRLTGGAYTPGLRNLKETENKFGVDFLINVIGETAISYKAQSGIPLLTGWHPLGIDSGLWQLGQVDLFSPDVEITNLPSWLGSLPELLAQYEGIDLDGGYIDIGSALLWHGRKAGYLNINRSITHAQNYTLRDNKVGDGKPNVMIVNLCSQKSNVFKPYDKQFLVDTGYFQQIHSPDLDLGEVSPDSIGYEIEELDRTSSYNYYSGAESEKIFGGDTYICRFGVRTTSMGTGFTYRNHPQFGPISIPQDLFQYSSSFGDTAGFPVLSTGDPSTIDGSEITAEEYFAGNELGDGSLFDLDYWASQNYTPVANIVYYMCESDDNINFRHEVDTERAVDTTAGKFFPHSSAASVLFESPLTDYTKRDNLLYESHYSAVQDIKVAQPYPKKSSTLLSKYPTRVIRSSRNNNDIVDRNREFLILDKLDLVEDTGEIWKITETKSVLYIQTENSLFVTKGQEQLTIGANNVFIGSGNIFAQSPDKVLEADIATGGTRSQFAGIRVPEGYFFVSAEEKKVYLLGQQIEPVSSYGMEDWFLENIPFKLEEYGLDPNGVYSNLNVDAPTQHFGFVSTYDPNYNRVILTKNEPVPTALFISSYNEGYIELNTTTGEYEYTDVGIAADYEELYRKMSYDNSFFFTEGGWTVSYLPGLKAWISRHSYVPKLYSVTNKEFYSYYNKKIWEHSDFTNPGNFYGSVYNFEFEFVDNTAPAAPKVFKSLYYHADVTENETHTIPNIKYTNTGFTSFYVYNTRQISGVGTDINYMSNTRLVDRLWYINSFRDMSAIETSVDANLVTGVVNVQDQFTTGVDVPSETAAMFTEEGTVNANYIDANKQWYDQKRFVDHFLAVRLIASNDQRKLINLYAAGTKHKQSFR